jgi:small subunit ribosomal protein S20
MPNLPSGAKNMRKSAIARASNKAIKSELSTLRGKFFEAYHSKNVEKAKELFTMYSSRLDKAAKKGVIKKNTAIRRKQRAANHLREIATVSAASA